MKKIFIFLSFVVLSHISLQAQDTIKVLTHNVLAFSGYPKSKFITDTAIFNRAKEFYKNSKADIIILQECPEIQYIKALAEYLNYNFKYFKPKYKGNETYPYGFPGCVLTKYPITDTLDFNGGMKKGADSIFQRHFGIVNILTNKGKIQVTGLHLCADWGNKFRETTRLIEIDILQKTVLKCKDCFLQILAGDCNSIPGSIPINKILKMGYLDTYSAINWKTVPIPNPTVRIDYIFVKGNFKSFEPAPKELPYFSDLQLYMSDHAPCISEIILK